MLEYGKLDAFKIEESVLRDVLNCLKNANNSRVVLHGELINNPELSDNKDLRAYINEYMREIRYWMYLATLITMRELRKKRKESEKPGKCLNVTYEDIQELSHSLMSYSKNPRSAELLEKLDALEQEYEDEEYSYRLRRGDIEQELE